MIKLRTQGRAHGLEGVLVGKLVSRADDVDAPAPRILLCDGITQLGHSRLDGVSAVVTAERLADHTDATSLAVPVIDSCDVTDLSEGDVVRIDPNGSVRTLYRRKSNHNTLFATERCNSLCVMCSQPPREVDDSWRVQEMLQTIALVDPDTPELGVSGGEPTLLGKGLLDVIAAARDRLPNTALHILSNGRLFRYAKLADAVGALRHHDLMIGIPVYSDLDEQHDYVVQSRGAFEDTILGLHNLARSGVPVEIRVVIHRHTYARLESLADYIYRNLTFASHVALMGLEATGFAKVNMNDLWIDPLDYQAEVVGAAQFLRTRGMRVSIYNHPLCVVPDTVWDLCRQSISDWKNEFHPACENCAARSRCGGFFGFNLRSRISRGISPLAPGDARLATLSTTH